MYETERNTDRIDKIEDVIEYQLKDRISQLEQDVVTLQQQILILLDCVQFKERNQ